MKGSNLFCPLITYDRAIETLRGAARGSYLETLPQLFSNSTLLLQILLPIRPKSIPKLVQILPRPSQIPPKSSQILRKIDPKSIQKPSWSPFWINALQKLDFERQKNSQEAPKSAQETPQTIQTPPKRRPRLSKPLPEEAQDPPQIDFYAIF